VSPYEIDRIAHHRERLVLAVFSSSQLRNGPAVERIAGKMKSADALDRQDLALEQQRSSLFNDILLSPGFFQRVAARVGEQQSRTTFRTSSRFGVKTAVERVFIFDPASTAHLKVPHSCVRPVIRYVFDYREAGTAIRAVDKWISVAPVRGIEQLFQAIIASRDVRGDGNESLAGPLHQLSTKV